MIAIVGHPILAIDAAGPRLTGLTAAIASTAATAGAAVQVIGKVGEDPDGDAVLLALARAGVGHVATLRDPAHRTLVIRSAPLPGSSTGADSADSTVGPDASGAKAGSGLFDDELPDDDIDPWWVPQAALEPLDPADRPGLDPADVELALRYLPDVSAVVVVEPVPGLASSCATEAAAAGAHLIVIAGPGPDEAAELGGLPDGTLILSAPDGPDPAAFASVVGRYAALVDAGTDPARAFEAVLAEQAAERAAP